MTPIDWPAVQQRLKVTADGVPGPITYGALFAYVAGRALDTILDTLARSAAKHFPAYGIDASPERLAEFLAQCANETGGFRVFVENLNYSAAAIVRTWPSRIKTMAQAKALERKPEALANVVYARPKEGNTAPGDGWRYRGRGCLQLTFRNNYRVFGKALGLPLEEAPDLAADPGVSLLIALEFWKRGKVNAAVDRRDYREARRITNGGAIGLEHVANRRAYILKVLS